MLEIISEILDAENHAESLISEAKTRSEEIRSNAEREAAAAVAEAKDKSRNLQRIELAKKEAAESYENTIELERAKAADFFDLRRPEIEEIITEIVDLVAQTEIDRNR